MQNIINESEKNRFKAVVKNKEIIELLDELVDKSLRYYNERLLSIVVFGSYASNLSTCESDFDVIIILQSTKKSNYEKYNEYYQIENQLNTLKEITKHWPHFHISPIIKNFNELRPELPYLWSEQFIIVYDKSNTFKEFTLKLKKFKDDNKIDYVNKSMPYYKMNNI